MTSRRYAILNSQNKKIEYYFLLTRPCKPKVLVKKKLENLAGGPFLERHGILTGSKSDFEIEISRKVGCVLNSNKVHFVSLAYNFTV